MRKNAEIYQEGERRIVKGLGDLDIPVPSEVKDFKSLLKYAKDKYKKGVTLESHLSYQP